MYDKLVIISFLRQIGDYIYMYEELVIALVMGFCNAIPSSLVCKVLGGGK